MEPWVRKVLAIPVITVALILCIAAIGTAKAKDGNRGDGPLPPIERAYGLEYVPLRGETVAMAVRTVVLHQNGKTYSASTGKGLTVKNQNVLSLARVPLLGPLTDPPYERPAFAGKYRVADVLAQNDTLFITLPGETPLPDGVVIFNQDNAFILNEKPAPATTGTPDVGGPVVASAYFNPEERNLLIMVRPSIIMDGGLF